MKYLLCLALFLVPHLTAAQTVTKKIHIPRPADGGSRYYYVPFDVPAGMKQLAVSYKYDKRGGENVLDLGLFDARSDGTERSLNGFRGWSGGRRDTVFVAGNNATNGYLAGDIPGGTWRVILGLYKVVATGVDVEISIGLNAISPEMAALPQQEDNTKIEFSTWVPEPPHTANGYMWFRSDLHMHTFHSDGQWTIRKIFEYAKGNNLDVLGFTDHNTTSHHAVIDSVAGQYPDILALRGEEVTTYGGHFNVWGLPSGTLIDFRVTPGDRQRLNDVFASAHKLRLPVSINHPAALCGGCNWSYGDDWSGADSVEVWNSEWDPTDEIALQKWDKLLREGSRITAIGSSDSHAPLPTDKPLGPMSIGRPTTFIGADGLTELKILSAIIGHRIYVAEKPSYILEMAVGNTTLGGEITAKNGKTVAVNITARGFPQNSRVRLVSNNGVAKDFTSLPGTFSRTLELKVSYTSYVRLEIRDASGKMLAFTNPIYIKIK